MQRVYGVNELLTVIREMIDASTALANVWVAGEVSNVNRPNSGHIYFTLKDERSQCKAVYFNPRYARTSTGALIQPGHAVVAHGRIGLYEARGDLQFIVDFVQPAGAGMLQLEFERLRERLDAEGLFREDRKRPLPRFPRRIGVVTSESGAVFHDICRVVERRWPLAEILFAPAPVQGPDAVDRIIAELGRLSEHEAVDVVIVGRGGGSLEELWAFNDERLARAIYACSVPVVSAVGHETDTTIADYVADRRAPTPSAAAEIVTPDRVQALAAVALSAGRLSVALQSALSARRLRVEDRAARLARSQPTVASLRQRVDDRSRRLGDLATERAAAYSREVGTRVWRLRALDPFATLERGYAIVQRQSHVVSKIADARAGERLAVRVSDGQFDVTVGQHPALRRRRRPRTSPAQVPLFMMPEERA